MLHPLMWFSRRDRMKILLAVDGSPDAQNAVDEVTTRPWPSGSAVKVVSVVQPMVPPTPELAAGSTWDDLWRERTDAARRLVSHVVHSLEPTLSRVQSVVRQGDAPTEIVAEANEWEADLIVVGSHSRSRLERLFLGSVAQSVINASPCSVEIVRHRAPRRPAA
jgi:nucleotide-binding universal stress UspA family protein